MTGIDFVRHSVDNAVEYLARTSAFAALEPPSHFRCDETRQVPFVVDMLPTL